MVAFATEYRGIVLQERRENEPMSGRRTMANPAQHA